MSLMVRRADGLVTVQDLGRPGLAHLGVPRAGALDGPASELANRLVGNPAQAAVLECTGGGLELHAERALTLAVTGARCPVVVDGRSRAWGEALSVPRGARIVVGPATRGLRAYVAVGGGIDVPPVLGSRATDTLAWLGPAPVSAGDRLPLGRAVDVPTGGVTRPGPHAPVLRIVPGPRLDWMADDTLDRLTSDPYVVQPDSNRIGLRLAGPVLERSRPGELPSEGLVLGAVQVPPDGQPVVFLHDHPVTGGYPVVAVVLAEDLPVCAQVRPGEQLTFRRVPPDATA